MKKFILGSNGRETDTKTSSGNDLGVSVRTVRRWEDRYEADGAEGFYDRHLGKLANTRVPTDTAMEMLTLFDSKYRDYSPRHFHESLSPGTGLPGATTGYASHYRVMAGSSPRPEVAPIGVNGPVVRWWA